MTTTGKAAAGGSGFIVGGGAVGVGVKNMMDMEPDATLLAVAENFSSTYTNGMLGNSDNNKNIFVDPDANQTWWEWIYKERISKEGATGADSTEFRAVDSGYSTSSDKALNKVCRKALISKKNELVVIPYKKDIWRYCSKSGVIPEEITKRPKSKTIDTVDENKFGNTASNKGKFVKSEEANEEWWNWIYENELKPDKTNTSKQDDVHTDFKSITKGYSSSDNNALSQVCKKAYDKKPKELVHIKYKKNVWKYCSKEGKVPEGIDQPPTATNITTIDETSKFGGVAANKDKLVDDGETNEEWWNWIYENEYLVDKSAKSSKTPQEEFSTEFKSVNKGYSSSENNALNKVCKAAYDKKPAQIANIQYKKDIWKYCSKSRETPSDVDTQPTFITLDNEKASSGKISENTKLGGVTANQAKLIADIEDNEEAWNWIFENKLSVDKKDATKSSGLDTSFSSITSGYSTTDGSTDALNKVCKTAHSKEKNDLSTGNYKKNVEVYCTNSMQESSLTLPEEATTVDTGSS